MHRKIFYIILLLIITIPLGFINSNNNIEQQIIPQFLKADSLWVDSIFNSLSNEERIGQLFMIAAYSNKNDEYNKKLIKKIRRYKPGGIIFFQGDIKSQVLLTNTIQDISNTPVLIGIDAERGLGSRLKDAIKFPKQMTLGAIKNNKLIFDMGIEIGKQCKRMGIHINFAPVADINNNPQNPIINTRSFGENKRNVSEKTVAYMQGMQSQGIIAVAKHFPGHGDTNIDSHKSLPIINHNFEHINDIELFPFKTLINKGIQGIMTAHICLPKIDPTNKPASISKTIITDILKDSLHFKGLCFTDALNMKAISNNTNNIYALALEAGNDILLFPKDIESAINAVKKATKENNNLIKLIDKRCKRILKAKYYCNLNKKKHIDTLNIIREINNPNSYALKRNLISNSITLVKNNSHLIPLKRLDTLNIANLSLNRKNNRYFNKTLDLYTKIRNFEFGYSSKNDFDSLIFKLNNFNTIIISLNKIDKKTIYLINALSNNKKIIINYQGNPYNLNSLNYNNINSLILSYSTNKINQETAAQSIFGGLSLSGTLPISINKKYTYKHGLSTKKNRLGYCEAEFINLNSKYLNKSIDSIIHSAINQKATPGCQILIAKDGYVIFNKSYGYKTYKKKDKISNQEIYDIASLTKVTATLPAIMQLYEQRKIKLNNKIDKYLEYTKNSNKKNLKIKDLLLHESGLKAYIPIFKMLIDTNSYNGNLFCKKKNYIYKFKLAPQLYLNSNFKFKKGVFKKKKTNLYNLQVCNNLFLNKNYRDTIYNIILNSELKRKKKYKYSDLGFIFLKDIIEKVLNKDLNNICKDNFYNKLGANHTSFLPLLYMKKENIVPSCDDKARRKSIIHGFVHDPFAALLGGISGNAGLFSNANDIAKIFEMYLQKGQYGSERYFTKKTLKKFTSKYHNRNRRGLGFDKPETDKNKESPCCKSASPLSYGHSGFTGTFAWCDPQNKSIIVFLSNRTYPNETNNKLIELNVRTNIQEILYKPLLKTRY